MNGFFDIRALTPLGAKGPNAAAIEREAAALIQTYGPRGVRIAEQKAIAADFFGQAEAKSYWLEVAALAARLVPLNGPSTER
jgi:hypothetical protein